MTHLQALAHVQLRQQDLGLQPQHASPGTHQNSIAGAHAFWVAPGLVAQHHRGRVPAAQVKFQTLYLGNDAQLKPQPASSCPTALLWGLSYLH